MTNFKERLKIELELLERLKKGINETGEKYALSYIQGYIEGNEEILKGLENDTNAS